MSNLYAWGVSQKLSVGGFEWEYGRNFDEDFIRNYDNEDNDKGYILDVSVKYPKELHQLHNLSFLPKGMEFDKCQNPCV